LKKEEKGKMSLMKSGIIVPIIVLYNQFEDGTQHNVPETITGNIFSRDTVS